MPADPQLSSASRFHSRKNRFSYSVWIGPLLLVLLSAAAFTALMIYNPNAREVAAQTLVTLISVITTPFILEIVSAIVFIFGLLAYNKWRRHKDGSDWVYLVTQEADPNDPPRSPSETQRLQSTVLTEKPEPIDEVATAAEVLEGYLELGMSSQAIQELPRLIELHGANHPRLIPLRIRILSSNLETEQAMEILHETLESEAPSKPPMPILIETCLDNARWLLQHLQRRDLASLWLQQAQQMHPLILAKDDPLHGLTSSI